MKSMDIADPFARQLMARYLSNRQSDLTALRDALAARDFDTIRITGHNLYGSGASYGLERISELGEGLETAAGREDEQTIAGLISALESYVRTLHPG